MNQIHQTLVLARRRLSEFRRYRRLFANLDALRLSWPSSSAKPMVVLSKELNRSILLRPKSTDLAVALKILENHEYAVRPAQSPRLIIDGGANIGVSTLYFANRFPDARIHSVEPEPGNFNLLKANSAGVPNVVLHQAALWPQHSKLSVVDPNSEEWAFAFHEGANGGDIPTVTIPQILNEENVDVVDILKLDIEGAEKALFSANPKRWLPRVRLIVIELHDRFLPGCSKAFYSSFCDMEFSQQILGENVVIMFDSLAESIS